MIKPPTSISKCRFIALATLPALSGALVLVSPAPVTAAADESADRLSYILFAQGSRSTTMIWSIEDWNRANAQRVGQEALLYTFAKDARPTSFVTLPPFVALN